MQQASDVGSLGLRDVQESRVLARELFRQHALTHDTEAVAAPLEKFITRDQRNVTSVIPKSKGSFHDHGKWNQRQRQCALFKNLPPPAPKSLPL